MRSTSLASLSNWMASQGQPVRTVNASCKILSRDRVMVGSSTLSPTDMEPYMFKGAHGSASMLAQESVLPDLAVSGSRSGSLPCMKSTLCLDPNLRSKRLRKDDRLVNRTHSNIRQQQNVGSTSFAGFQYTSRGLPSTAPYPYFTRTSASPPAIACTGISIFCGLRVSRHTDPAAASSGTSRQRVHDYSASDL